MHTRLWWLLLFALGCPSPRVQRPAEPAPAEVARQSLDPSMPKLRKMPLAQAFAAVSASVAYEPYAGALRSAEGTARSGAGNSLDKALLLADALRAQGHRVRFVRGTLSGDQLAAVLKQLHPTGGLPQPLGPEFAPYNPLEDPALTEAAADHWWLEVADGEAWTALDPSFPGAQVGQAYAAETERHEEVPPELFVSLRITHRIETGPDEERELGSIEGQVAELALKPLSLLVVGTPGTVAGESEAEEPEGLGGLGMLGGAEKPKKQERSSAAEAAPQRRVFEYRPEFHLGGEAHAGKALRLEAAGSDFPVRREWLEFVLLAPGAEPRTIERTLYAPRPDGPRLPAPYRRYGIAVVPGRVPWAWVQKELAARRASISLDARRKELSGLSAGGGDEVLVRARALESEAAEVNGQLIPLLFAAESDRATERLAATHELALVRRTPRILVASFETSLDGSNRPVTRASLDLRLDEVGAHPRPGSSSRAAYLFQTARGMLESKLEGEVLGRYTGPSVPITTARLMSQASAKGVPLLALANATELDTIAGPPAHARDAVLRTLQAGRQVVLPKTAVELDGRPRWGFWDVDPRSGAVIGVMEDGEHQAMTEKVLVERESVLNPEMAFILGVIIGADYALFTICNHVLDIEGGEADFGQLAQDIEASLCAMCPKVEAKVGVVEVKVTGDCLKKDWSVASQSVKELDFCARYQDGFQCAVGLIFAGHTKSRIKPVRERALYDVTVGCIKEKQTF